MAKNITLSVDEAILDKVRIIAAQRKTSINGLVRDYLADIATADDRSERARRRLLELAETSKADMGAGYKWNRDALYDD